MKEISKPILNIKNTIEEKYLNGGWMEIEIETPSKNNIDDDEPFDSIIQPYLDKLVKEIENGTAEETTWENFLNELNKK